MIELGKSRTFVLEGHAGEIIPATSSYWKDRDVEVRVFSGTIQFNQKPETKPNVAPNHFKANAESNPQDKPKKKLDQKPPTGATAAKLSATELDFLFQPSTTQ